jgi:tRNA(fMet)-specific endonuclease VapC
LGWVGASAVAYLLDTNVCIQILNGHPRTVAALRNRTPDVIRLCSVVVSELAYGAYHSASVATNLVRLRQFCAPYLSLPFDDRAADECGQIRAGLRKSGRPIGPNDLLIAAIARINDLVLVTNDAAEFRQVPGLQLEDWQAG